MHTHIVQPLDAEGSATERWKHQAAMARVRLRIALRTLWKRAAQHVRFIMELPLHECIIRCIWSATHTQYTIGAQ